MKTKIIKTTNKYVDKFFITQATNNTSYIIMVFPYVPFKMLNYKKYAQIDAYYLISNASYYKAKSLAKELNALEVLASYRFDINYKKLMLGNNFASQGKNTLIYLKEYGSRFVMQVVEIEGKFNYNNIKEDIKMDCSNCNLCKNACPVGAITNTGFNYLKCLRYRQEQNDFIDNSVANVMQNKLLGCDICQSVCPYNKDIKKQECFSQLKELLKLENLLKILSDKKQTKFSFGKIIGTNYARQKMLLAMTILVAGNSKNNNLIDLLKEFKKEKYSPIINKNALRAINNIKADKKG